jgi:biotin carboxyl carrier protein
MLEPGDFLVWKNYGVKRRQFSSLGTLKTMAESEFDVVKKALEVARKHGFRQIELSLGETSFSASLQKRKVVKPSGIALAEPIVESHPVKSTMVGYVRLKSDVLQVGATVKKGQIIASVQALGLNNDLEAPIDGEVTEVLVAEGDVVDYGFIIAKVKP